MARKGESDDHDVAWGTLAWGSAAFCRLGCLPRNFTDDRKKLGQRDGEFRMVERAPEAGRLFSSDRFWMVTVSSTRFAQLHSVCGGPRQEWDGNADPWTLLWSACNGDCTSRDSNRAVETVRNAIPEPSRAGPGWRLRDFLGFILRVYGRISRIHLLPILASLFSK